MPLLYRGRLYTEITLWDSSRVLTKGAVVNTVALGMVGLGLAAGVAVEDGSDCSLLASGAVSGSSSSTPYSLSEPLKPASNRSHSLGTGESAIGVVKLE